MEEHKRILRDVFGESSSDSEDDEKIEHQNFTVRSPHDGCKFPSRSSTNGSHSWVRVAEIKGLWLCQEFLCPQKQSALLSSINEEEWFSPEHNQAMRFGDLPEWAIDLANSIHVAADVVDGESDVITDFFEDHDVRSCVLPPQLLRREPLFDHLIGNVYQPGEGICAHVDLMRFEDGIAIVSLESACVMHFSRADSVSDATEDGLSAVKKIPVYLNPGSLVIMWGDARYHWKHEINRKPGFQVWEGQEIEQKKRTSITLRKLRCST